MSAVIRDRIFPAIDGLEIRRIDHGEQRGVIMVYVPPQLAARTPFLVRGAVIDDSVRTTYFGVPERAGEHVHWADIATLHGLLQAGKLANAIAEAAASKANGEP
jgi:hypothetical protein